MTYRKDAAVSITNLRSRRHHATPFSASGFRTAAFALLATASVAIAQVEEQAPIGDPIEETWRYLVELFRMILGI